MDGFGAVIIIICPMESIITVKYAGANITYHRRHSIKWRTRDIFTESGHEKWRIMDKTAHFFDKNGRKYRF